MSQDNVKQINYCAKRPVVGALRIEILAPLSLPPSLLRDVITFHGADMSCVTRPLLMGVLST